MIATEPDTSLVQAFDTAGGSGKPKYGQLPICYDTDEDAARARAGKLWRWAMGGWNVLSELPDPRAFNAVSSAGPEDDVTALVPCGRTSLHVKAARKFTEVGLPTSPSCK